jgi:hypothetical protein
MYLNQLQHTTKLLPSGNPKYDGYLLLVKGLSTKISATAILKTFKLCLSLQVHNRLSHEIDLAFNDMLGQF